MACQQRGRGQRQVAVEIVTGVGEHLVEHASQGEHGGPGVHGGAAHMHLAQFAARDGCALEQHDVAPVSRQIDGGGQSGDAGADHSDARDRQVRPPKNR